MLELERPFSKGRFATGSRPIVPVPLRPGDLDNPPGAIIQEVDRQFGAFEASREWERSVNRIIGGASLVANTLFAHFTKRGFDDFRPSAKAPNSLPVALTNTFRRALVVLAAPYCCSSTKLRT